MKFARMWQFEDVMAELPTAIRRAGWDTDQEQSALADLYTACGLPQEIYEAAIMALVSVAKVALADLLRLAASISA